MAQKKKTNDASIETKTNGTQQELVNNFDYFLRLSQLLLNEEDDDCPFRINEMKETLSNGSKNPFIKQAKDLCEELGISWDGEMSAEDSNRVMINMLGDAFMNLKPSDKDILHVKYKVDVVYQNKKTKSSKEEVNDGADS